MPRSRPSTLELSEHFIDSTETMDATVGKTVTPQYLLAKCCFRRQNAFMGIQITIRDVPEDVRDELAARAARQHQSMQEFLRAELQRIASKPSLESWLEVVTERKQCAGTRVSASKILRARDADRR